MGQLVLSVLMPAYMASATILNSVKSALNSLPENSEVLVYLDGKDPATSEIIFSIPDKRLRLIGSDTNHGVIHARNALLENALGKFVANLDADDISLPGRFHRQIKLLESKDIDLVFSNSIAYRSENRINKFRPNFPFSMEPESVDYALCIYNPFVNSTMMTNRETLVELGGFKNSCAEDYEMWLRAAKRNKKMFRESNYGVLLRVHTSQMTQSNKWKQSLINDLQLRKSLLALAEKLNLTTAGEEIDLGHAKELLFSQSTKARIEVNGLRSLISGMRFDK